MQRVGIDIADKLSTIADIMSAKRLPEALFPRTRSDIFRELFRSDEGLHLRELERRTGVNSRHLLRELRSLHSAGILASRRVGNQVLYRFDRDCPIYEDLLSIIRKTVGIADALRDVLEAYGDAIELAYIFGSVAEGKERPDSDIDLMMVGSVTRRQVSSTIRQAERAIRREINPTFYRPAEYETALEDENSFVSRVHAGPRINLIGGTQ